MKYKIKISRIKNCSIGSDMIDAIKDKLSYKNKNTSIIKIDK